MGPTEDFSSHLQALQRHKKLESAVRKALHSHAMIEERDSLSVALSGGKDSLTLLYLLAKIRGRGFPRFALHAIHVQGAFSCGASIGKTHLHDFCQNLDIPLHLCNSGLLEQERLECYSCARRRRSLIFSKAKELGSNKIAFGHHREDHLQTLMMNLLHKGEFAGMLPVVPMIKYGVTILRPLIDISEQTISSFAHAMGFLRTVCRCPVGVNSQRAKAEQLLKQVEAVFPHARLNLARAGHLQGSKGALRVADDEVIERL